MPGQERSGPSQRLSMAGKPKGSSADDGAGARSSGAGSTSSKPLRKPAKAAMPKGTNLTARLAAKQANAKTTSPRKSRKPRVAIWSKTAASSAMSGATRRSIARAVERRKKIEADIAEQAAAAQKLALQPYVSANAKILATSTAMPRDAASQLRAQALVLRAQENLLRRMKLRHVATALNIKSQDEIAHSLGTSQATVSRMAKLIKAEPQVLAVTPTEMMERRAVGAIDDQTMMAHLLQQTYTAGTHDPTGGDGYVRGSWREIENGLTDGLLTDDEYERIAREAAVSSRGRRRTP